MVRFVLVLGMVAACSAPALAQEAVAKKTADKVAIKEEITPVTKLAAIESSINDLLAQLVATPLADRSALIGSHLPSLLERLGDISEELASGPEEYRALTRKADRLSTFAEEQHLNRYLLSPEEYALWRQEGV